MAAVPLRLGLVTCPPEKLRDYFPTAAEPDLVPTEPPFTPDDQLLVDELRRHGHQVDPVIWGCPAGELTARFDGLVVRSPWDYMDSDALRLRFMAWLTELDRAGLAVENHPRIMAWLTDKRYLHDLAAVGVPVVASALAGPTQPLALLDCFGRWGALVVKPCISAAGAGLVFLESQVAVTAFQEEFVARCRTQWQLVQPFVPEIRTAGEWSLVYLGGTYSHAVHKLPGAGKILVHAEQGGSLRFAEPPPAVLALADRAVAHLGPAFDRSGSPTRQQGTSLADASGFQEFALRHEAEAVRLPPLYLRVDVIASAAAPLLSECEGVEPELFFRARPSSVAVFRRLLEARLSSKGSP